MSPPGSAPAEMNKKSKCAPFSYVKKNALISPKKLFNIAMDFVAKHVIYVDSFDGLPEEIGHLIFQAAEERFTFLSMDDLSLRAMKLFCMTYSDLMLSSMNLSGRIVSIGKYEEYFSIFTHIQKLDLSFCRLGDDHTFLQHISQSLNRLRHLYLVDSFISDKTIQILSIPINVSCSGLACLEVLKISGNKNVTDVGLHRLSRFPKLLHLDLSDTSITKQGIRKLYDIGFTRLNTEHSPNVFNDCIKNEGWAGNIVNEWSVENPKHWCQPIPTVHGFNFYKNKKINQAKPVDRSYIPANIHYFKRVEKAASENDNSKMSDNDKKMNESADDYNELLEQYSDQNINNKSVDSLWDALSTW